MISFDETMIGVTILVVVAVVGVGWIQDNYNDGRYDDQSNYPTIRDELLTGTDYTDGTMISNLDIEIDRKCDYDEMRYISLVGDDFCMRQIYLYESDDFDRIIERCTRSYYTDWSYDDEKQIVSLECVFIHDREFTNGGSK